MDKEIIKSVWPEWEVVRPLGSGSFGSVYEIERKRFGVIEKAALKVISIPQNKEDIEELHGEGYDDESITTHFQYYIEDIIKEYQMMKDLSGHSNIVNCDDYKIVKHNEGIGWDIFIKMELLIPLSKILQNRNNIINEKLVVRIAKDICQALVLCNSRRIVHRDIKPENIFVSEDGNFKLGDFGIAKIALSATSGTKAGTYKYMAPEVNNNEPYGDSADIYSLGLVLYCLMNESRMPFLALPPANPSVIERREANSRRFRGEKIPEPINGSEELKKIVLRACEYNPADRYSSAKEMLEDLNRLNIVDIPYINVDMEETDAELSIDDKVSVDETKKDANSDIDKDDASRALLSNDMEDSGTYYEEDATEVEQEEHTTILEQGSYLQETSNRDGKDPKRKIPIKIPYFIGASLLLLVLLIILFTAMRNGERIIPVFNGGKKTEQKVDEKNETKQDKNNSNSKRGSSSQDDSKKNENNDDDGGFWGAVGRWINSITSNSNNGDNQKTDTTTTDGTTTDGTTTDGTTTDGTTTDGTTTDGTTTDGTTTDGTTTVVETEAITSGDDSVADNTAVTAKE